MYNPIEIDRINLTLMGVKFPDLKTLENTSYGIGSNMFEGFEPDPTSNISRSILTRYWRDDGSKASLRKKGCCNAYTENLFRNNVVQFLF
jgi:hypothetical protein